MKRALVLNAMLIGGLVLAACGGGAGSATPVPQAPTAGGTTTATATGTATASAAATTTSTSTGTATSTPDLKSPIPSAIAAELQALGLEPKKLRDVMKLIAKSLGAKCGDCHKEGDFEAPTRRKKIAAHMWNDFAAKLAFADGSPLFCDSCHQGRFLQLDRRDKKALGKWMDANFVDKLKRKDGKSHECETCHVDNDMHFLAAWGK